MTSQATPAGAAPATKAARQARIATILSREQVHSQEQLAALLDRYAGMHVAQATLSRDLDELGVVRLRAADGSLVYALPEEPGGPGSRPGTVLDYPERSGPSPATRNSSRTGNRSAVLNAARGAAFQGHYNALGHRAPRHSHGTRP